jgi:prevent-host-death family protein
MREIGVRALKSSLSETLREAASGQEVRVTVRGRPLVDIVPAGTSDEGDRLRRLVAQGRLTLPTRRHPARAPRLVKTRISASSLVLAERDAER